jgi:Transposase DDE domain/Domain of unknown function (DUF4372)
LIFGQLCERESLRDLATIIEAHQSNIYHLGFGKNVSRSNLSKADEKPSYQIFEEFAYHLIVNCQTKNNNESFEIKGKIYAFDATTIDLCLSVFYWVNFRKNKAGIKLHPPFEINTQVPVFVHFINENINNVNAMDCIKYEQYAYYIFDKAYFDFLRLLVIEKAKGFRQIYSQKTDKYTGIIYDQIGKIISKKALKNYSNKLRRIKYYDQEKNKIFVYLTKNFELSALQIALLYKQRWQIELFFKWIKQHFQLKTFWGTSQNAVRIQINIAKSPIVLLQSSQKT